ncbi:unnamed protein product [Mytilus coruscus]|uniref:Novel STAND NTPase 3 domain-containing protein n=1 Tax=Mytilus coruscus TaxID=42192 RepID=A0A6J8EYG7_MYTCO|nr:unnamed protein product [Mytilus coruscus]
MKLFSGEIYEALLEHREDKAFLRPAICDAIDKQLQENNIVVITGREGTGKSKLSLELASIYNEKGYVIMKVDLSENYAIYTNINDALLIIDDKVYTSDSLNALMKHLLPVLLDKNIKVVLTCSNLDLETVRSVLEKDKLKDEVFIDINRCLNVDEKEKMLKRYLKTNNIATSASSESNFKDPNILTDLSVQVTLDDDAIKVIKNEEPWKGFPLCASLFSSNRKCLHLGEKYFTNPPSDLFEELKELYKTARENSNCIDTINEYCILVYIMNNSNHHLDLNENNLCRQFVELYQTLFQFKYTPERGSNEDKKIAIEKALHRMNNKYLRFQEGVYTFIHPCLSIAMFLSSDYMVHYLLQKGSLIDITELVRSKDYTGLENELVIKIDKDYHHILGERLMRHAFENLDALLLVTQYIYKYWRSSSNEMVNMIFSHIEFILFQSFGVKTDYLQQLDGEEVSENSIKAENQVSLSKIIMLVDELTYKGRDPWIYASGTDFLILSGLVTAAMGRYATNRNQTFDILLSEFQNRVHSESFVKQLRKPLDIYRNTFFHFLMIFSQKESCQILSLITGEKRIFDVENVKKFTPIDIAAYLGKRSVLEVLDLKTNCTKNIRNRLRRLARSGNIENFNGNSKNKMIDQAMVNETADDGTSPEKLQSEYADDEKKEVIDESKQNKSFLKKTFSRSKDKPYKTEKHDKLKCESEFIDILYFEDAMLNIVDFGKLEDYQACINLLS